MCVFPSPYTAENPESMSDSKALSVHVCVFDSVCQPVSCGCGCGVESFHVVTSS